VIQDQQERQDLLLILARRDRLDLWVIRDLRDQLEVQVLPQILVQLVQRDLQVLVDLTLQIEKNSRVLEVSSLMFQLVLTSFGLLPLVAVVVVELEAAVEAPVVEVVELL
jgi:hypothetical protein